MNKAQFTVGLLDIGRGIIRYCVYRDQAFRVAEYPTEAEANRECTRLNFSKVAGHGC